MRWQAFWASGARLRAAAATKPVRIVEVLPAGQRFRGPGDVLFVVADHRNHVEA